MKLPKTDQFLLDLIYDFLDGVDDITHFLTSNRGGHVEILFGLENPVFKKYRMEHTKEGLRKLTYRLKKKGFIKDKDLEHNKAIIITKEGLSKALRASFKLRQDNKERSDGKWIMIIFDISKRDWRARNLLMSVLKNLGYKKLQHSVWITPYDVSEKTEKLLQFYDLDKYVKLFLIEKM